MSDVAVTIRKKVKKGGGEAHHGGAWKVAYADFVTAMMAFFLLMWLLNATTEQQRKGIADYFDPSIPIARISAGGSGVLNGDSAATRDDKPGSGGAERAGAEPGDGAAAEPSEMAARLDEIAAEIEASVKAAAGAYGAHVHVRVSPEGVVIEIADTEADPLFASGQARPTPALNRLLGIVAPVLGMATNRVAVVGHTDATPFRSAGSDNWGLSAERAVTAKRALVAAGFDSGRIARVSGRAATEPLVSDPTAPQNRRISLMLLREG